MDSIGLRYVEVVNAARRSYERQTLIVLLAIQPIRIFRVQGFNLKTPGQGPLTELGA
ncbi:MAG TPA: hypothetical protein VK856_15025 [Anaerolineaceae bacterium]|nr:hypothetical protein [Anaerolineaceae bacterium]